jgi:hypothetical protein
MSGQSAYISANAAIDFSRKAGLVRIELPPISPAGVFLYYPDLCLGWDSAGEFVLNQSQQYYLWNFFDIGVLADYYFKIWYAVTFGNRAPGRERWKFLQTIEATVQSFLLDVHGTSDYSHRLRFQGINQDGRQSAYSYMTPTFPQNYLAVNPFESLDNISTGGSAFDLSSTAIQGDYSVRVDCVGGPASEALIYELPSPFDYSGYKYAHFFIRQPVPISLPSSIDWIFILIDDGARSAKWNLTAKQDQFTHIKIDLDSPDVIDPGFDIMKALKFEFYFENSVHPGNWSFYLDYLFVEGRLA